MIVWNIFILFIRHKNGSSFQLVLTVLTKTKRSANYAKLKIDNCLLCCKKIDVLYAIFNNWIVFYGKVGFNFAMLFPEYDQEWDLLGISTPIVNCWAKLFIEDWGRCCIFTAAVRCSTVDRSFLLKTEERRMLHLQQQQWDAQLRTWIIKLLSQNLSPHHIEILMLKLQI